MDCGVPASTRASPGVRVRLHRRDGSVHVLTGDDARPYAAVPTPGGPSQAVSRDTGPYSPVARQQQAVASPHAPCATRADAGGPGAPPAASFPASSMHPFAQGQGGHGGPAMPPGFAPAASAGAAPDATSTPAAAAAAASTPGSGHSPGLPHVSPAWHTPGPAAQAMQQPAPQSMVEEEEEEEEEEDRGGGHAWDAPQLQPQLQPQPHLQVPAQPYTPQPHVQMPAHPQPQQSPPPQPQPQQSPPPQPQPQQPPHPQPPPPPQPASPGQPLIVIDGPNVCMHGISDVGAERRPPDAPMASAQVLQTACQHWQRLGCRVVAFLPRFWVHSTHTRDGKRRLSDTDIQLLRRMVRDGVAVLTPPQDHDDLYMIEYASERDGWVLTNDMYRDHVGRLEGEEAAALRHWLRRRLISYTLARGELVPNPGVLLEMRRYYAGAAERGSGVAEEG